MKNLRAKQLFGMAFAIIVIANIIVLLGVYKNRKSEPTSLLTLTEREMPLRSYHRYQRDIRQRYLSVTWKLYNPNSTTPSNYYRSSDWLDEAKLKELGFNIAKAKNKLKKFDRYERVQVVYIALELDGKAYQNYLEKEQRRYDKKAEDYNASHHFKNFEEYIQYSTNQLERAKHKESRLFVVDASRDFDTLRKRYAKEHYIITKAQIKLRKHYGRKTKDYTLGGYISKVMIPHIQLSKSDFKKLKNILKNSTKDKRYALYPKYKITLAFGSRLEPYIVDIAAIEYRGD